MKVSKRLKEVRESLGKTQTEVSKDTGINNKTLSGYERGVSEPDLSTLQILASYYSVSVDYLLGGVDEETPRTKGDELKEDASIEDYLNYLSEINKRFGYDYFDVVNLSQEEKEEFAKSMLEYIELLSLKFRK